MTEQILYENPNLSITYHAEIPCLVIVWRGFTNSQVFREGLEKIFQHMVETKVRKTLTDIREHKGIGIDDQNFAAQKSVEFDQTHWKVKRALIMPKDVFARFAVKNVNAAVNQQDHQDRQMFGDYDSAIAWLKGED
ncbi:MAG: hypothetical protein EAZ55_00805 [Cytophagales bacterium]|nr:MAG: hypothetical protein EAZ55_00805 [Cytophagales bacterium]